MNRFYFTRLKFFLLILLLLAGNHAHADEGIRNVSPYDVTVPLILTQEAEIRNIDIDISGYDDALLELTDLTLTGGVLEDTAYNLNHNISDETLRLTIYAAGELLTASGELAQITLRVEGAEGDAATLWIDKFECNDNDFSDKGGFRVNGAVSSELTLSVNRSPVADDMAFAADEDQEIREQLSATDGDGDPLKYMIFRQAGRGTVELTDEAGGEFLYTPDPDENGTDTFTFHVTDGQSESDIATVTIEITAINDPPVFTSQPVTAAIQDSEYLYEINAQDADTGDMLTFSLVSDPLTGDEPEKWFTLTDNGDGTATLSGIPGPYDVGEHEVELRVSDEADGESFQSFAILVENISDPPAFTSSPVIEATQDLAYVYEIEATDPDFDDTLSITALEKPGWLEFSDSGDGTAVLSGIPTNDEVGNHSVILEVRDAEDTPVTQEFTIFVENVNDAPAFISTPVTDAHQGKPYAYRISVSDIDAEDALTITAATLPNWLKLEDLGNGTALLSGTPGVAHEGKYAVEINVTDRAGAADSQLFDTEVSVTNTAPFFTSHPLIRAISSAAYDYAITATDADTGDALRITATATLPNWLTLNDKGNGGAALSGTPGASDAGDYPITLQVSDKIGATDFQSFTLQVSESGDGPIFASDPITVATTWEDYTYTIFTINPDASGNSVVEAVEIPDWLALTENTDSTTTLAGTPSDEDVGAYEIILEAMDPNTGISAIQSFRLHVSSDNEAPEFTSTPVTEAAEDMPYAYSILARDRDAGDMLTLTASVLPEWLTFRDNGDGTALLSGMPSPSDTEGHLVRLKVTDIANAADIQEFTIHVANINHPPAFTSTPITKAVKDTPYAYQMIASDADPEDALVFNALILPNWLTLIDSGDRVAYLVGTPTDKHVGTHSLALDVRDAGNASDVQIFTINVSSHNEAPIFVSDPLKNATEDVLYAYPISTIGPDTPEDRSVTAPMLPSWLSLASPSDDSDPSSLILTGTPSDADVGDHNVRLEVRNAEGAGDVQEFVIHVENINDPPKIMGQTSLRIPMGTPLTIIPDYLKVEDPDDPYPNGFTLTLQDGQNYSLQHNTIAPLPGFEGVLAIPMTVSDGEDESDLFSLRVTVYRINSIPTGSEQQVSCPEDEEVVITLEGGDSDEDDRLSYTISQLPYNGSLFQTPDGSTRGEQILSVPTPVSSEAHQVIYAPYSDGNGDDYGNFGFQVSDGKSDSREARVIVDVIPVNDAPFLKTDAEPFLTEIDENNTDPPGDAIFLMTSGLIADVDGDGDNGIAVTQVDNTNGVWQYARSGSDWSNFTSLRDGVADISDQARLLSGNHLLRFVPNPDWSGTASLTFRAWDQTSGTSGETKNLSAYEGGGITAFSSNSARAVLTINALPVTGLVAQNDSPTVLGSETSLAASSETGSNVTYTWDLGDGTSHIGPSVIHTYPSVGQWQAKVVAENPVSTAAAITSVTVCAETLTVTQGGNSGEGSLPWAVANVCDNGTVRFSDSLAPDTLIELTDTLLIYKNMNIQNTDVPGLTVSGNEKHRIFEIGPDQTVSVEGLNMVQGWDDDGLGGAIYNQGNLTLERCTLSENSSEADNTDAPASSEAAPKEGCGGAVFNRGTLTLNQCTISGNRGYRDPEASENATEVTPIAGGIFNKGILTLNHCTLYENTGDGIDDVSGIGGIHNIASVWLSHTIIAGNSGTRLPDVYGKFISRGYNLIGRQTGDQDFDEDRDITGTEDDPVDPLLGALKDNGGLALTHALLPDSPAIDAGNPEFTPPPDTDQRGRSYPRVHDGDRDEDAQVDIGAYELSFGFLSQPVTEVRPGEAYLYEIVATTTVDVKNLSFTAGVPNPDPEPGEEDTDPLPEWLELTVNDDGTATLEGTPMPGDVGTVSIKLEVRDTFSQKRETQTFDINVLPISNIPMITGQRNLETDENTSLPITLEDLVVIDGDSLWPDDFTLTVYGGENYTLADNTLTPVSGFAGTLTVPVSVSDGSNESNRFPLSVIVGDASETETHSIGGVLTGLEAEHSVRINAWSPSAGMNRLIEVRGTGEPLEYRITNLEPASDYQVEISSSHYLYQISEVLDLSDEDISDLDFTLTRNPASISGTLIFPGDAVPGETLEIYAFSPSTGSEGSVQVVFQGESELAYVIEGLRHSDDYEVSILSDRYIYENQSVSTNSSEPADFELESGASISGTVFGPDLDGVYVEAWSESRNSGSAASVSKGGTYQIEGLVKAPDLVVQAWKDGIPFFYNSEETVRSQALTTLVSTENANPEAIDIMVNLAEFQSIRGTVYSDAGDPLTLVWVDAWSEALQAGSGVFTNSDGRYVLEGLPEGEDYRVTALPDASTSLMSQEKQNITTDARDVDFTLEPRDAFVIQGAVTDTFGNFVPGIEVEIWSPSQNFYGLYLAENREIHTLLSYLIQGLPAAEDYMLFVTPPENSGYAVFIRGNLSVRSDTTLDMVLESALRISGTVYDDTGSGLGNVRVSAFSEDMNFYEKSLTDEQGFYEIPRVPEMSDYRVTAIAEGYVIQEKLISDVNESVDFFLEPSGFIFGTLRDENGDPISGVTVAVSSERMRDLPHFSGLGVSGENGDFRIEGLRVQDAEGNLVTDYWVTAYPENHPPLAEFGKKAGDEVNFSLSFLAYEQGVGLSGTVADSQGNPLKDVVFDIFQENADYIKSVPVDADGSFYVPDLSSDMRYELRFTLFEGDEEVRSQWAGVDDIGFDDPDPNGLKNPDDAKVYEADDVVNFRFSRTSSRSADKTLNSRQSSEVRNLRVTPSERVIRQSGITATWESDTSDARYYYRFDTEADLRLNKRNVPAIRPLSIQSVTSQNISGDDIPYYFHVAPVDRRGRIGETSGIGFRVDTVPPSNLKVSVPSFTASREVTMTLGATGAARMYISNAQYGQAGQWETWTKTRKWTIPEGEGEKKIYVQFSDRAGNTANALALTEKVADVPGPYEISVTQGENGAIQPSGLLSVYPGDEVTFIITPASGYETDKLFVNGTPMTLTGNTYTLRDVTADMSVAVTFRPKEIVTHTITASAGPNGSIEPSGQVVVNEGDDITFTVVPDPGYAVDALLLDGKKVRLGPENTFRFINVAWDYALSVSFKRP